VPALDPPATAALATLPVVDDALTYQTARLARPCDDCRPGERCDDHAADEDLIARYQDRHAAAFRDFLGQMDPADVEMVLRPGDITPMDAAATLALLASLRDATADGPVLTGLGGGPAILEPGPAGTFLRHPLLPEPGDPPGP
jgi:hypothetical protein